jgi:hypothetical protein
MCDLTTPLKREKVPVFALSTWYVPLCLSLLALLASHVHLMDDVGTLITSSSPKRETMLREPYAHSSSTGGCSPDLQVLIPKLYIRPKLFVYNRNRGYHAPLDFYFSAPPTLVTSTSIASLHAAKNAT